MSDKKYELINETINHYNRTLYRIKALRDFGNVKAGDIGGYVEKEDNLSHLGSCWVSGSARVSGSAWVSDSAWVSGSAWVSDSARVYGSARVSGSAWVKKNQEVRRSYDCRSISGFSYLITILPFHINVGCKTFDICDLDNVFSELPIEEVDAIKVIVEATMDDIHRKIAEETKDKE